MTFGNLRAIMHQGVDAFLAWLADKPDADDEFRLIADLDGPLPRDKAVVLLGIAIEAALDNYNEYMDYNSSTTQSDRGEMLYTLLDFLRLVAGYDRVAWHSAAARARARGADSFGPLERGDAVARDVRPADRRHRRRAPRAAGDAVARVRHEAAKRRRSTRRTVRPPAGNRPAPGVDRAGDGRRPGRPALRRRSSNSSRPSTSLPRSPRASASWCRGGWKRWKKKSRLFGSDDVAEEDWLKPERNVPQVRLALDDARRQVHDWGEAMFGDLVSANSNAVNTLRQPRGRRRRGWRNATEPL